MVCGLLLVLSCPAPARAQAVELSSFSVVRSEDGVLLSYVADFELPPSVEDALHRGVPLHFEARAELLQSRWYWRDKRIARATLSWRLTYRPLTRNYRLDTGGLNQNFDTLAEALDSLRRRTRWKIADAAQIDGDGGHYVEFAFGLNTSLLPRPMQIGIGGETSWSLSVERSIRID
ncbi:MAG: DUF4390 domain-containing protein [Rhizobacter sp.]|nr:DUF4390 domain-containing protein [Burkholderiaceae bacterium]MCO5125577.1 DUF4390 domain-containing protein [Rhizobacter sp.]